MNQLKMIVAALMLLIFMTGKVGAQVCVLSGKVVDEDHQPIELATVACMQQGKVTATNLKGEFTLTLQSEDSVVVKFSMVGYNSKKRVLRRPRGKLHIEVTLPSMQALGEVRHPTVS